MRVMVILPIPNHPETLGSPQVTPGRLYPNTLV